MEPLNKKSSSNAHPSLDENAPQKITPQPRDFTEGNVASDFKVKQFGEVPDSPKKVTEAKQVEKKASLESYTSTKERLEEIEVDSTAKKFRVHWMFSVMLATVFTFVVLLVVATKKRESTGDSWKPETLKNTNSVKSIEVSKLTEGELISDEALNNLKALAESADEAREIFNELKSAGNIEDGKDFLFGNADFSHSSNQFEVNPFEWSLEDAEWVLMRTDGVACGIFTGIAPDFKPFSLCFRLENGDLKIDWKATTRWSSASFDELAKGKGNPSEIRGEYKLATLYTTNLPEKDFVCYLIGSPHSVEAFWGYAKRDSEVAKRLASELKAETLTRATFRLSKNHPNLRANQWLIEEVLSVGWVSQ